MSGSNAEDDNPAVSKVELESTKEIFVPAKIVYSVIREYIESNYLIHDLEEYEKGYAVNMQEDPFIGLKGIVFSKSKRKRLDTYEEYQEKRSRELREELNK